MQIRDTVNKTANSLFTWAISSWYTKLIFGIALIIVVVRLSTTCISMLGVEIGCVENLSDHSSEEMNSPESLKEVKE